jgi:hypothetical protein
MPLGPCPFHRVVEQCERRGLGDKSVHAIIDEIRVASDVCHDGRSSTEHGLAECEGRSLEPRGKHEGVVGMPHRRDVVDVSGESHVAQIQVRSKLLQGLFALPASEEGDLHVSRSPLVQGQYAKEDVLSLGGGIQPRNACEAQRGRGVRRLRRPVVIDLEGIAGKLRIGEGRAYLTHEHLEVGA